MKDITVCIVDDNNELRNAYEDILNLAEGFICMGTMATPEEAISYIPMLRPDIVLMDINLGTKNSGIDCVRVLKPYLPGTNFMMCTVYDDDDKVFDALRSGASAYMLKKTEPEKMLHAIKELYEGGAPMNSEIARKLVSAFQRQSPNYSNGELNRLSEREIEILELLAKGLMYKEIAAHLYISPETVRKHAYNIYAKLHVNNRVAAVNKYYGR